MQTRPFINNLKTHKYAEKIFLFLFSGKPCTTDTCFSYSENFLGWERPGIGRQVTFMSLQGLFYFSLVLMVEYGFLMRIWAWFWPKLSDVERVNSEVGVTHQTSQLGDNNLRFTRQTSIFGSMEDSDVAEERERIMNAPLDQLHQTDSIIMKVHKKQNVT